jgi:hypothetical protein
MPEENLQKKYAPETAWGKSLITELVEAGKDALYLTNFKNDLDARKSMQDAVKAEQAQKADELRAKGEQLGMDRNDYRSEMDALVADRERYNTDFEELKRLRVQLETEYAEKGKKQEIDYSEKGAVLDEREKALKQREEKLNAQEEKLKAQEAAAEQLYDKMKTLKVPTEQPKPAEQPEKSPTYVSLGGDRPESPTDSDLEKTVRTVKKMKKKVPDKLQEQAPYKEPELAQTRTSDGKPTVPPVPEAQVTAATQMPQEGTIYKHDFPVDKKDDVEKALKGFCGIESSEMTTLQGETKFTLAAAKADGKSSERDYSFNKSTIKVEFNTKNQAVDTMLNGIELGQPFKKRGIRPSHREKIIEKHPDFAWLCYAEETDEKGKIFVYELNEEQMKRYDIKVLAKPVPAKKEQEKAAAQKAAKKKQ